jgi:uncharacterized membrane protein YGL010W
LRITYNASRLFPNSLFYNSHKTPALGFAMRTTLCNFNDVTDTRLIPLVVDAEFRSTLYVFTVLWMFDLVVNGNFDAFVTTIAYYNAG